MATKKNLSFEQALARLEEIASGLEDGSMTLEASLKAYEEGIALANFCEKTLAGAKLRLTEYTEPSQGQESGGNEDE